MQDYNYEVERDGVCVPCSQLSTPRINELLSSGIRVISSDGPEVGDMNFIERGLERLRIELVIRGLEGRT